MRRFVSAVVVVCVAIGCVSVVSAQEAPAKKEGGDRGHINETFESPKLDVESYVKRFEKDDREAYAAREAVVSALGLKPGMKVADIGAGTGFYARLFAAQVGPEGKVYAVDISPGFLKHIAERAKKDGQDKVIATILGTQDDTRLPAGALDLVFTSDTYHHFEKPEVVLATIYRALRPGGRLAVIDFDRREDSSEFIKNHARAAKEVYFKEITAAGFELVPTSETPPLRENFFAMFQKVETPAAKP